MRRTSLIVATLALVLAACRGDTKANIDAPGTTADSPPGSVHIQDVQNDSMSPGSAVELHGVIVTAVDAFGAKTGDIWVEEPGGGPFSGIHVFSTTPTGVAPGDIVDITGAVKDEFALTTDPTGRTITELKAASAGSLKVMKTGTGSVPAPAMVDALAIGQMDGTSAHPNAQDNEWEKWEGVLITVKNVSALGNVAPITGAMPDPTFKKISVTGSLLLETSLADFPTLASGDCIGSVTGVADYFFDHLLLPRSTAEIVTGGTACPAENTSALCLDGTDNDGNGFKDCADNACVVAEATCHSVTTIPAIQAAIPTLGVELDDVFVTAVSFNHKIFWVSTSLTAAANNGIAIVGNDAFDAAVVPGARVTILGTATEFNNDSLGSTVTEVRGLHVTVTAAPATPPVPVVGQMASSLVVDATGEPYESVLVTLTNVKVTMNGDMMFHVGQMKQGSTTFLTDDDIFRILDTELDKCYATITGIWTYQLFNNAYGFFPIAPGTGTGVCN